MDGLYKTDFYAWSRQVAESLRTGAVPASELENIAEEIESLGRSEHRELKHRLEVLLMHRLKWDRQPNLRSSSWENTIEIQRNDIRDSLNENPSLRREFEAVAKTAYKNAVLSASIETGLGKSTFPAEIPYDLNEL